jgi:hypothetical protein
MSPDAGTSPEIPENEDYKAGQRTFVDSDGKSSAGTPGAEGGDNSDAADTPPGLPADHDAEVGSTDQHSDA